MSRCCDVVAIQLRGPKRRTGTWFRGYFPDGFVVISIFLLVGEDVSKVDQFRVRIVGHSVGPKIQLDGIKQFESVPTEDAEHPVISASYEHLIEGWNEGNSLCFLKTTNAFQPFAGLKVDHFERAVLEAGHKEPL